MRKDPFQGKEKNYIRRLDYANHVVPMRKKKGEKIIYFGLPSPGMRDVQMWSEELAHIFAIERDPNSSQLIQRKSTEIGVRGITTIVELTLGEVAEILSVKERHLSQETSGYTTATQERLKRLRHSSFDVVNIDLCGGLVYSDAASDDTYVDHIMSVVEHQKRVGGNFEMLLTFQLRDTGADDYEKWIIETLDQVEKEGKDTEEMRKYYLSKDYTEQSIHLRRMSFCVPSWILKECFESFLIKPGILVKYNNFIHLTFSFKERSQSGAFGEWPPTEELLQLLQLDVRRVFQDKNEDLQIEQVSSPSFSR
jgi:hypothetical protein